MSLDGLRVDDAKRVDHRVARAAPDWGRPTITYKLRDWLFSRQRYWGEPFPIVYDEYGPVALPESMLPVVLPEVTDFEPVTSDDPDALPEPPLARAADWVEVELDLHGPEWAGYGQGRAAYLRETNTMPQWAGSCWYYLRYLDPDQRGRDGRPRGRARVGRGHARRRFAEGRPRRPLRRRRRARGAAPACTRASGTRCCSTSGTCRRPSRSSGS